MSHPKIGRVTTKIVTILERTENKYVKITLSMKFHIEQGGSLHYRFRQFLVVSARARAASRMVVAYGQLRGIGQDYALPAAFINARRFI